MDAHERTMDLNKLTLKSQAALQGAREQARARNQQTIEPEHLLFALLVRPGGRRVPAAPEARGRAARAARPVDEAARRAAEGLRRSGARCALAPGDARDAERAFDEAEELKDEYVSTEHLLLALLAGRRLGRRAAAARRGLTRDGVLDALAEVRGSQRVTDPEPRGEVPGAREVRARPHRAARARASSIR